LEEEGVIVLSKRVSQPRALEMGGDDRGLFDECDEFCEDISERFQLCRSRRKILALLESDGLALLGRFHCGKRGGETPGCSLDGGMGKNGKAGPINSNEVVVRNAEGTEIVGSAPSPLMGRLLNYMTTTGWRCGESRLIFHVFFEQISGWRIWI